MHARKVILSIFTGFLFCNSTRLDSKYVSLPYPVKKDDFAITIPEKIAVVVVVVVIVVVVVTDVFVEHPLSAELTELLSRTSLADCTFYPTP